MWTSPPVLPWMVTGIVPVITCVNGADVEAKLFTSPVYCAVIW